MVFASITFLYYFLPLFFIAYLLCFKSIKAKNIVIVVFSLIFYAWGEPVFVFLLILSTYINFKLGILIEQNIHENKYFIIGIIYNVLLIFVFKYLNLVFEILEITTGHSVGFYLPLPIGISFYTFQSISYLVDVKRNDVKAQERYFDLLLYISMFPQLIAGPIVRYKTICENIYDRKSTIDNIFVGIERIVIGLGKKVLLANQLSIVVKALLDTDIYSASIFQRILGVSLFVIELYFDFSGYSDIAIGIGKIIGFKFEENFDYPLYSFSMTEFWRKWHMSLGSFFRDYVYISLGGKKNHQIRNIFIVWFLTGIWHGAHINYVLWGIFLAVVIIIEKLLFKTNIKIPKILSFLYFIAITIVSFAIFYFSNIYDLRDYFDVFSHSIDIFDTKSISIIKSNINLIILSVFLSMPIMQILEKNIEKRCVDKTILFFMFSFVKEAVLVFILILSTILLIGETNNPFLYTQF